MEFTARHRRAFFEPRHFVGRVDDFLPFRHFSAPICGRCVNTLSAIVRTPAYDDGATEEDLWRHWEEELLSP
jgi:hypothetical protein